MSTLAVPATASERRSPDVTRAAAEMRCTPQSRAHLVSRAASARQRSVVRAAFVAGARPAHSADAAPAARGAAQASRAASSSAPLRSTARLCEASVERTARLVVLSRRISAAPPRPAATRPAPACAQRTLSQARASAAAASGSRAGRSQVGTRRSRLYQGVDSARQGVCGAISVPRVSATCRWAHGRGRGASCGTVPDFCAPRRGKIFVDSPRFISHALRAIHRPRLQPEPLSQARRPSQPLRP